VRRELGDATKEHLLLLENAVVMECDDDGKVKLRQAVSTTGAGTAGSAAWGPLIGLSGTAALIALGSSEARNKVIARVTPYGRRSHPDLAQRRGRRAAARGARRGRRNRLSATSRRNSQRRSTR
jgi:hypothetical protein